jgi:hypothetical protein
MEKKEEKKRKKKRKRKEKRKTDAVLLNYGKQERRPSERTLLWSKSMSK